MIRISAFKAVPPFAQGLVRDIRVRWALEEARRPYEVKLIDRTDQQTPGYRALQPFGQVPSYEEDGLTLFESGAIVFHIGETCEALLPRDETARSRAIAWMFAALNSVEPPAQQLAEIDLFPGGEDWKKPRRPGVEQRVKQRLAELSTRLGDKEYLDGRFSAGDLLMTTVLRILRHTELVKADAGLAAYQTRCEARPAFQRALAAQLADFETR